MELLGKSASYRILEQCTRELWQLQHEHELINLENGFYVARFFCQEDYLHVLEGRPCIMLGHYQTVSKWKPNFHPSTTNVNSTLVWVCFPNLPMELFDEEILFVMEEAVGRTVKVDATLLVGSRGCYARLCVDVNLAEPFLPSIAVFERGQKVEYEGLY